MRITKEKIDAINDTYNKDREGCGVKDMNYRLIDACLDGTSVYRNGWHICNIEEIPALIRELERMSACIQFETGIVLE